MKTRDEQTTLGPGDLEEEAVLALWDRAWRMARRRCAGTLIRLRRGDGGFYGADDFYQDLFVEFWELLERRGVPQDDDEERAALWKAWGSVLWGGGRRILRRVPQRLWTGTERAVEPATLALEYHDAGDGLSPAARQALVQAEDAEATRRRLSRVERVACALWRLQPLQRQIIYMSALRGLPADRVARRLGLRSRNAAYQRLHRARRAMRRALHD